VSGGNRERGFGLTEHLVSMLIAAILVAAMLEAYLAGKSALGWQRASSSLDARGYRALDIIGRDLRMAGFYGGLDAERIQVPPDAPGCGYGDRWALTPDPLVLVSGPREAALAGLNCLPLEALQSASALVGVRRSDGTATWGPSSGWYPGNPDETQWYLRTRRDGSGDFLWVDTGPIETPVDEPGSNYWAFRAQIYYLRSYSVRPDDDIPTLCVERLMSRSMRSECLVEGVEVMHLELAVDSDFDGQPDYLSLDPSMAALATHVQVYLLLRSLVAPGSPRESGGYDLGRLRVEPPADGHLRRVYAQTVAIMNRRRAL
jgi:type IV pilus assembly protein PilW